MGLPASGNLSVKSAAGASASISLEEDGNETGNKSMRTLALSAGKSTSMRDFLSYESTPLTPTILSFTITSHCVPVQYSLSWSISSTSGDQIRVEVSTGGGPFLPHTVIAIATSDSGGVVIDDNSNLQFRIRYERTSGGLQVGNWAESSTKLVFCV